MGRRAAIAVAACTALVGLACSASDSQYPQAPTGLDPVVAVGSTAAPSLVNFASAPNLDGPSLDLMITKSMLYSAGIKYLVNPYLVMGLAWHESGWQETAISSAGAVGIMQVMPATAAVDGPWLLHRQVNLYDAADNIELGTAILKNNLDHWHNDLAKALCAYYAGGGAATDWSVMRPDCKRYVWAVYNAAIMFKDGKGPV